MRYSYCLKNGRIIDPACGIDRIGDIYIKNSRIAEPPAGQEVIVQETVDASACLVLPGLIDFHTHLNHRHSDYGLQPDAATFPHAVTSAVEPGSAGSANFEGFYRDVVCASNTTIKSFVNVTALGIATAMHTESLDPATYDLPRLEYLFERYPEQLLGLKLRFGKMATGSLGLEPLRRGAEMARHLDTSLYLHVAAPEYSYDEILSHFAPGDYLGHCFQDKGGPHSILDENGKIRTSAREARERGVIFDAAFGRRNLCSFKIMRQAILEGFPPDIISTDTVAATIFGPEVFGLPYVMSVFLAAGMPLADIVSAVTQIPARHMRMEGQIGTLAPGALADVAILHIREKPMTFTGYSGDTLSGDKLFVPQMAFKAGRVVFRQIDFTF
ncbi:MAG: amidohydrolase family protein [Candidatus Adiutrix sp.]|jgi:dihydroorotase|nr:amidohydrolase family protein [Candidatus Adiutrix sp.]